MKRLCLLALASSSVFIVSPVRAVDFNDIQFWAGTGANQAALVIDWNDGQSAEALVWGYRWNGAASGLDMFEAVVNADSRLFAHLGVFGFGTAVSGIGYDLNGNGVFGVSPSLSFDGGGLVFDAGNSGNFYDSRAATDIGDHFLEGANSGFWGYYGKASSAASWDEASSGAADRVLSDGVWDGWSFAPGFSSTDPSEPGIAAVPEPTICVLLLSSGLLLVCSRRKRS